MSVLKGSFFTGWKFANQIRLNKELKNFFYYNSPDDRNIFFGEYDYNEENTLQMQLKQNINIFIDLGNKNTLTIEEKGKTDEYDLQQKKIAVAPATISLFAYNPTQLVDKTHYTADMGENEMTIVEYLEFACFTFEKNFHVSNPINQDGRTNGIPFIERQYEINILFNDILQEKDLEEGEFYLDRINVVKSK